MFFSSSRAVGPVGHFRIVQEEKNRVDVEKTNLCFLSVVKTKESAKSSSQPLLHFLFLYNSEVAYKGAMFFSEQPKWELSRNNTVIAQN